MRVRGLTLGRVVAVALALALARMVLRGQLLVLTNEECHTGGVALEVLRHGLRFPLGAYTPEFYENGIVIQGLLAVPFVAAFGPTLLALKLLSLCVSTAQALLGLSLVRAVARELDPEAKTSSAVAQVAWLALFALGPPMFTYKAMDALGDENEAVTLSLAILLGYLRALGRRDAWRAALFFGAGLAAFWQKGTLLATAVVGLHAIARAVKGRDPRAALGRDAIAFATGMVPAVVAAQRTGLRDVGTVAEKFSFGAELLQRMLGGLAQFILIPPLALAVLAAWVAWGRWLKRLRGLDSAVTLLASYVFAHLALMPFLLGEGHVDYFQYGYPLWIVPVAVGVTRAGAAAARRRHVSPRWGAAAAGALAALIAFPIVDVRLARDWARLRQPGLGACAWRFGRAFLHANDDRRDEAARWCRRLDGRDALDCVSGLGFEAGREPDRMRATLPFDGTSEERLAFAFGAGRMAASRREGIAACAAFTDAPERDACERGFAWDCVLFTDLFVSLLTQRRMPRVACEIPDPGVGPFEQAAVEQWRRRPTGRGPDLASQRGYADWACRPVIDRCFPSSGAGPRR